MRLHRTILSVSDYSDTQRLDLVYHSYECFITNSFHFKRITGFSREDCNTDTALCIKLQYCILGRLPPHLCSLLTPTYSSCSFCSIGWQLFQIPRVFNELGKSVFSYFAPSSRNTCQNTLQLTAFISLGGENFKESILVPSEPNDTQMTESWVLTFL